MAEPRDTTTEIASSLVSGRGRGRQVSHPLNRVTPIHPVARVGTSQPQQPKTLKNLVRRSHTKSRRGCFPCKTRKIKCGEERPSCSNCIPRGSTCVYPAEARDDFHGPSDFTNRVFIPFIPNLQKSPARAGPTLSSLEMHSFNHFLTSMKHPLPVGNHSVWVHEIPQLSDQHGFLKHAIIALGASDLARSKLPTPPDYDILKHRGRALAGMNKTLNNVSTWTTYGYADALLATCYALIYQSATIPDGMTDYYTLVQGCALITSKIMQSNLTTVLAVSPEHLHSKVLSGVEYISAHVTDMSVPRFALRSLEGLQADMTPDSTEYPFWRALCDTLSRFVDDPVSGYAHSILAYSRWYVLAVGLLDGLSDPDNDTAVALAAIFMANMVYLKALLPYQTWPNSTMPLPLSALRQMAEWIDVIHESIGVKQRQHLAWPLYVAKLVSALPVDPADRIAPASSSPSSSSRDTRSAKRQVLQNLQSR